MNRRTSKERSTKPCVEPMVVNVRFEKKEARTADSDDSEHASFPSREPSYGGCRLRSRAGRDENNVNGSKENKYQQSSDVVRSAEKSSSSKKSTNRNEAGPAGGSRITSKTSDKDAISRRSRPPDDGNLLGTYNNGWRKTNKTLTNGRGVEDDRYYSGEHGEEREALPERDSSASASRLSSADGRVTEFIRHFSPEDFDDSCDSETDDSSSSTRSRETSVMIRTICRRNESPSRTSECRRTTEKPADYDGPAALEAAYRRLIFDKTKEPLAKHLVEGLYRVSKSYRHDPFGCLSRWLLIRADIGDEDRIEHEPTESRLQTPR